MTDIWKSLSLFGKVQVGSVEFMDVNFERLNVQPNTSIVIVKFFCKQMHLTLYCGTCDPIQTLYDLKHMDNQDLFSFCFQTVMSSVALLVCS